MDIAGLIIFVGGAVVGTIMKWFGGESHANRLSLTIAGHVVVLASVIIGGILFFMAAAQYR